MEISRYLAMTAGEIETFSLPEGYRPAYMACHFSAYGTGLSNVPARLAPGSMLILNDRTPICGHDPEVVCAQLEQAEKDLECDCVLLDFQRAGAEQTRLLCEILTQALPCPAGVSDLYAEGLDCPVFVSPVPADQSLAEHLAPWDGREIWLDTAPAAARITVTEAGSVSVEIPFSPAPADALQDDTLRILYTVKASNEEIVFDLRRGQAQLDELLSEGQRYGVTKSVGLYQQLFPQLCEKSIDAP